MKRLVMIGCFGALFLCSQAQSQEAEQLLLDWQKLSGLKKILKNLYQGYKILYQGYSAIQNISEGNFSLHRDFLDALLQASPAVKKYKRVGDIISCQIQLVQQYRAAITKLKDEGNFTPSELDYIAEVYAKIFAGSLRALDELSTVLTSGTLRMNDEERLSAIDRIYDAMLDRYAFSRNFNDRNLLLSAQRAREQREVKLSELLNGIQ
jgi:hypothetical protein